MSTNDAQVWNDKKQLELDALHQRQMEIAQELTPMLAGKQLDLMIELVDVYGKLSDFQNGLVDDCCEMIDTLMLQNKKMLQNQKARPGEKPAG